jgi:ABC-type branched-subunit amino acid transport system ATPase component
VEENLYLGTWALPKLARKKAVVRILEDFPSLQGHLRRRAGLLSGGQRRMLALTMTMMSHPKLVLLDEPSAGLSPSAASELYVTIKRLGLTKELALLWVEQRTNDILCLAQRAVMLHEGAIVAETLNPRGWLKGLVLGTIVFGETR